MINKLIVHNTGGIEGNRYASTAHQTFEDIDLVHKNRWDSKSSLGYYAGYNIMIRNGQWKQFRAIGEETIANRGYNLTAVSIAMSGNHDKDPATGEIVDKIKFQDEIVLKNIGQAILNGKLKEFGLVFVEGTMINIKPKDIIPHWIVSPTSCYGNALSEDWARKVVVGDNIEQRKFILRILIVLYTKLLNLYLRQRAFRLAYFDKNDDVMRG